MPGIDAFYKWRVLSGISIRRTIEDKLLKR